MSRKADRKRRRTRAAALPLLVPLLAAALIGCTAREAGVTGTYDAVQGHTGTMVITEKPPGRFHVELNGGGRTGGDPGAVAADCQAVAEGELADGVLRAHLVPFKSESISLEADDLKGMDVGVRVSFGKNGGPGMATVEGAFGHCGVASALYGEYKRR